MTRRRNDSNSTEFGLWLREQPEIDSSKGYTTTNVDFVWMHYRRKLYMLIEEKRYRVGYLNFAQVEPYQSIHRNCVGDPLYRGFHKLVFEKTSPEDGWVSLNDQLITREMLVKWLRFEAPYEMYQTTCIEPRTIIVTSVAGVQYVTQTPAVPFANKTTTITPQLYNAQQTHTEAQP